jgi:dipeptide/tripeptide permease
MAARTVMAAAGLIVLGIILLAAGAVIEPPIPQISQSGESLIALGLTLIVIGVGFFFAWAAPS